MPFPNNCGKKRLWTREKVLLALKAAISELQGPLPCADSDYNRIKKGRLDWPPSSRVLEYYHGMGRAWLAAGAAPGRITLSYADWLPEEDEFILEHAGSMTLQRIGDKLHRSYYAVRTRLGKTHGVASRHNQGFLSAAELAKEYQCPYHRIRDVLRSGKITGTFDARRNRWQIDMADILFSPVAQMILHKPKRTHKTGPTDVGDYYRRHGLKRTLQDGKVVVRERHPVGSGI